MYYFAKGPYNTLHIFYSFIGIALNGLFKRNAATFIFDLKASLRNLPLAGISLSISKLIDFGWYLSLLFFQPLSAEWYRCTKFLIIRKIYDLSAI